MKSILPNNTKTDDAQSFIKQILIGSACGIAATLLLVLIFGMVLTFSGMPLTIAPVLSVIALGIGSFVAGFISSKLTKSQGLIKGIVCGIVFAVLMVLIGLIFIKDSIGIFTLVKFIVIFLLSAFGGILGVNSKIRRRH